MSTTHVTAASSPVSPAMSVDLTYSVYEPCAQREPHDETIVRGGFRFETERAQSVSRMTPFTRVNSVPGSGGALSQVYALQMSHSNIYVYNL